MKLIMKWGWLRKNPVNFTKTRKGRVRVLWKQTPLTHASFPYVFCRHLHSYHDKISFSAFEMQVDTKKDHIFFLIKIKECIWVFGTWLYLILTILPGHSSTLAWKIPWTEEPGGLQSMGSLGVGHDWATSLLLFTFIHPKRKWQPTPVFLSGESQGWGSLVGCRLWGRTELDTTEVT